MMINYKTIIAIFILIIKSIHCISQDILSPSSPKIECYKIKNKWHFVDSNLLSIDNNIYDSISLQFKNSFIVKKRNKFALCNSMGQLVTKFKYKNIKIVYSQLYDTILFCAISNKLPILLSEYGQEETYVQPPHIVRCREIFSNSTFTAWRVDGGYRVDNSRGIDIRIPRNQRGLFKPYQDFKDNANGTACAKENNKWTVIDKNFNQTIPFRFDSITQEHIYVNDYLLRYYNIVYDAGKCGFVNIDGILIIKPKYKSISNISPNYLWAKTFDNKQGWVRLSDGIELFQ